MEHTPIWHDLSRFTDFDIYLFRSGRHYRLWEKFGSHLMEHRGVQGTYFAVWAPNAAEVSVIGSFNRWDRTAHPLAPRWDGSGIWEGFVPHATHGNAYKYFIRSSMWGLLLEKGDPYARRWENPPHTASVIWNTQVEWRDQNWVTQRAQQPATAGPMNVYEMHLGSWRHAIEHGKPRPLTYRELAEQLPPYLHELGFTHVEFMPVMEYPYDPSWGYQIIGYFAPTSRFGTPEDFAYLVDSLHRQGIGVILDWVPSHFPEDPHALAYFDGTHLYEHADPRKGWHPDWKSLIFNYGRNEVRSFLISNAAFWVEMFHADGLRVDAVASMLYLDYSRQAGEWVPNQYGGNENLEAVSFLRELNTHLLQEYPYLEMIAEESTSWPKVSRPVAEGGLGFTQKWMMGWMHDTLNYFKNDPIYRRYHHGSVLFSIHYFYHERFMLPLSHDEVVHGKGSLLGRMPGDEWQRFANLRLLYGYMWTHPGTRLLFMGGEFGQRGEWKFRYSLDWHLLENSYHYGVRQLVRDLNGLHKRLPALYECGFEHRGFEWLVLDDHQNSVMAYARVGNDTAHPLVVVCNFTPVVRRDYRVGVPQAGTYAEVLNTDDRRYGGSGVHQASVASMPVVSHGREQSLVLTLPPLAVLVLECQIPEVSEVPPAATPARARKSAKSAVSAEPSSEVPVAKRKGGRSKDKG